MKNILIKELKQQPVFQQPIEIVERKGLGHPDYICDAIANEISVELCKEYLKKVGTILHHNIDKALLAAGETEIRFNGGVVKKPMLLVLGDRATFNVGDIDIQVPELAIATAKKWFKTNMRYVNPDEHLQYQIELKPGSAALQDIFKRKAEVLGANDTSAAVGYAPFTQTEKFIFDLERFINSEKFHRQFPEAGEDVKVMGYRNNSNLDLTIALAFVDRFIDSEITYFRRKEEILQVIQEFSSQYTEFKEVNIALNTLDERGRGIDGLYLTVLGTSADGADCGQVGRGNRANGVISLNRPASEEAAAGKNPVSHVGKIYNLLSFRIAEEIYNEVSGLQEVYIWLLSQIGRPITDPKIVAVQVILEENTPIHAVKPQIEEIVNQELENINKFCRELAEGKISMF